MIGKTISHYKIIEKLGGGGMGIVYKAEDTKLHRTVALKFLPPELTRDEEAKQRFINEAQAASSLDHNNICVVHEIDESEEGQIFICMNYYEGETLKRKIASGPLLLDEAIDIILQIAKGLQKAHERKITHRDIKPANIFLTNDGIAKILDFGLAKLSGRTAVTEPGTTMGTTAYMSPEQIQGGKIDYRTDIWSLGVILYEMITGQLPFKGDYEQAVFYSILSEEPRPVTGIRTGIPLELERIINKALVKNPEERYQHIDEMIVDLKKLLKETETSNREKQIPGLVQKKTFVKKYRKYLIPAAVIVIAAAAFMIFKPFLQEEIFISEPMPIAVITFENQTGDESFDYLQKAIPNLLITNLEQSKYFRVTTWERMQDLLSQMGKADVKIIDKDLGFDLCRREGVDIIVIGSYVKAGNMFATDIKILDVATKQIIKSAGSRGEGIGSILENQIDDLSRKILQGVGVSYSKIIAEKMRVIDVTTNSMEAYNYFLKGQDNVHKLYFADAKEDLENAISIDSSFATAYLYLSYTNYFLEDKQGRNEAIKKAYYYSSKATEKERLRINAAYAAMLEGNSEKTITILKKMAAKYPKEKSTFFELGWHYNRLGKHDEAIQSLDKALYLDSDFSLALNLIAYVYSDKGNHERAIQYLKKYSILNPGDANPFDSMGDFYWIIGQVDSAEEHYKKALEVKTNFVWSAAKLVFLYMGKEDYNRAEKWAKESIEKAISAGLKSTNTQGRAFLRIYQGRVIEAEKDINESKQLAKSVDNKYLQAFADWLKAYISYDVSDYGMIDKYYAGWLNYFRVNHPADTCANLMDYKFLSALVDIRENRIAQAKTKFNDMKLLVPNFGNNSRYSSRYNLLKAEILLAENYPSDAINVSRESVPQEVPRIGYQTVIKYNTPFMKDILARSYQKAGQIDNAISEYERLVTYNPKGNERYLIHPRYHYRLAVLYEEKGLKDKAVKEYKRFLELWKNADENLPEPIDAKKRLDKLLGK